MFKYDSFISKLKEYLFNLGAIKNYNSNYDDAGLLLRTGAGLYVCLVENSKLNVVSYSDFVADKNKRYIKIRLKDCPEQVGDYERNRDGEKGDLAKFLNMLKLK